MCRTVRFWVVGVALAVGCGACAKSDERQAAADVCFDREGLESWDEQFRQSCSVERDTDVDGEIDSWTRHEFDDEGRLVEETQSPDGEVTRRMSYDGLSMRLELYSDGELFLRSTTTYDELGNRLAEDLDDDGDGETDRRDSYEYGCFDDEAEEAFPGPCRVLHDRNLDGEIDWVTEYRYDNDGHTVSQLDSGYEDHEAVASTYVYEEDRIVRVETDRGDDGTIDEVDIAEYDDQGNIVRETLDYADDGMSDWLTESEYDDHGHVVRFDSYRGDELVLHGETDYDAAGYSVRQLSQNYDSSDGPSIEYSRYDGAHNLIATAHDADADGSINACAFYSYACLAE